MSEKGVLPYDYLHGARRLSCASGRWKVLTRSGFELVACENLPGRPRALPYGSYEPSFCSLAGRAEVGGELTADFRSRLSRLARWRCICSICYPNLLAAPIHLILCNVSGLAAIRSGS